ncbi:MAG: tRNA uridine-5-carboxymethylaminomethyl(34) synthesis GTPase MnmE [Xanthobacteraceae bacterium]|nr:tRNA uridine-5-carboxymethylaminomethyl(34) synthesis GTPase MnmE [Xanthobacteraceae bacterium]MCW5673217.1 tRNA uridine-5-carboxymethylaminomethyl(34) synthesis GTPase MnmE [Xanthobacteraceae bacterium]
MSDDTIFALSSGRLPAAIAVVRISGANARVGLETFGVKLPEPRRAARAKLIDPDSRETVDDALALWFQGPKSETGEDMVELHLHGGRAILARVFAVLGALPGFRPAEAGEFTKRAVLNGKMDLSHAEGLGDLVVAETEAQRRQAMHQYQGALSKQVEAWRELLVEAMALIEANLDFADEADVPENLLPPAARVASEMLSEIEAALSDARRGERLREGFAVAIAGAPNAGKSTLLNALAQRDVAIVSDIPGTTRDAIEVALDLSGVPVVLIDTAGIRETSDPVEQEGVRRAMARAEAADLVLLLEPAGGASICLPTQPHQTLWKIQTKSDLIDSDSKQSLNRNETLAISAKTGAGIDELLRRLAKEAERFAGEPALVTRERQRVALREASARISSALSLAKPGQEELFAEELRLAARSLGRITGRVDVEDVLDKIFSSFCIGK